MSGALTVSLESIAGCFEGIIPSAICTVSEDGTPNVTYLSVVSRVDETHVALPRQFFKKTEANTLSNPLAQVSVIEPATGRMFWLDLVYERTETEGPLFERMRTRLDAVAAFEGMSNVFKLRGVDVCRVTACEMIPCKHPEGVPPKTVGLDRIERLSRRLSGTRDMEDLLQTTLAACDELLGYDHAFIMLLDETGERLYTVASSGYAASGAGSEVRVGEGLIGLAAERRQSIRVTQMARDLAYSQVTRAVPRASRARDERVIPLPALPAMQSQLVTPMLAYRELLGVLCLQSEKPGAFQAIDESVVAILASQVAMAMAGLRRADAPPPLPGRTPSAEPLRAAQVKHYCDDDSIFIDNEYLIKGVAGGILWRLLRDYRDEGRVDYSNREIRLDSSLDLPDIKDNLEARLILLRKRLQERCDWLRIERTSRGRFRLVVDREIVLSEVAGGSPV